MPKGAYLHFLRKIKGILPEPERAKGRKVPDFEVYFSVGRPSFRVVGKRVMVKEAADMRTIGVDAAHLVSKLLESELNRKNVFSMHGAALTVNGRAFILMGRPKAGKSVTSIYSCLSDSSVRFITDDRIFIDAHLRIVCGSGYVRPRGHRPLDELTTLGLKKIRSIHRLALASSNNKAVIPISSLGIRGQKAYPVSIGAIFILKRGGAKMRHTSMTHSTQPEKFIRHELEVFNQIPGGLAGGKLTFGATRSRKYMKARAALAKSICKTISIVRLDGSTVDMSNFMLGRMHRIRL